MPTLLLIRHGRSTANTAGVLAGWTPEVHLDDRGREQASHLAERLAGLDPAALVISPLVRCAQTIAPVVSARPDLTPQIDDRLGECHYGAWTGRSLTELAKEPLWETVQRDPARAVFPPHPQYAHESLAQMSERVLHAVREHDQRVAESSGPDAVWIAVSHGDVIKAIVADALGSGLRRFQRIVVSPASISAIRFPTDPLGDPLVLRINDTGATRYGGAELGVSSAASGGVVGGGAGAP